MVKNVINSTQHPDVKFVKALTRRKERREHGLFVIEGLRFVEEAVCAGIPLVKAYFTAHLLRAERGAQLVDKLTGQGVAVQEVAPRVMEKMAATEQPQGMLATVRVLEPDLAALENAQPFLLICDKIQDPGNLGTIIRSADAAGVQAIFTTTGTVDVYNAKVLRSTMGSIFRVPVFAEQDIDSIINILSKRGIILVGTTLAARQWHFETDFCRPVAIWLGGEAAGIENSVMARLPELVKIPMPGGAESLNVAAAASILMFECVRQRLLCPLSRKV